MKKFLLLLLLATQAFADTSQTGSLDYNNGGIMPKNYIKYGNATKDSDLAKWTPYNDGATLLPIDCTGGTVVNTAFTRKSSGGLRDGKSFLFTKGNGTNAQGEGRAYTINLDPADQGGKSFLFSMDYIATGLGYFGDSTTGISEYRIYAYDVTNSKIVYPSGTYG